MKIMIGLGNPERRYDGTRHNIGFSAVVRLSDDYHISCTMNKHKALCGAGYIEGEKVLLAMPQTYMNASGESVRELVDFYKVEPEDILVIYDDISLAPGQLRIREKGSAGGHNGIKNIISHLGTDVFPRIKIGVGQKPEGWDLVDYVLGRFPNEEEPVMRDALKRVSQAVSVICKDGIGSAMNQFNKKV